MFQCVYCNYASIHKHNVTKHVKRMHAQSASQLSSCQVLSVNMSPQNKTDISEKCYFYNVGYCKHSEKGCNFKHPVKQCDQEKCDYKTCPYRHQKQCRYFLGRKGCYYGEKYAFKHENKMEKSNHGKPFDGIYNLEDEIVYLKM